MSIIFFIDSFVGITEFGVANQACWIGIVLPLHGSIDKMFKQAIIVGYSPNFFLKKKRFKQAYLM